MIRLTLMSFSALSILLIAMTTFADDKSRSIDETALTSTGTSVISNKPNSEIAGQKTIIGGFKSVSGMDSETEVSEPKSQKSKRQIQQKNKKDVVVKGKKILQN